MNNKKLLFTLSSMLLLFTLSACTTTKPSNQTHTEQTSALGPSVSTTPTTAKPVVKAPSIDEINEMIEIFGAIKQTYNYNLEQELKIGPLPHSNKDLDYMENILSWICNHEKYHTNLNNDSPKYSVTKQTLDSLASACFAGISEFKQNVKEYNNFTFNPINNTYTSEMSGDAGPNPTTPKIRKYETDSSGTTKVTVDYIYTLHSQEHTRTAYDSTLDFYLVPNPHNTANSFPWAISEVKVSQTEKDLSKTLPLELAALHTLPYISNPSSPTEFNATYETLLQFYCQYRGVDPIPTNLISKQPDYPDGNVFILTENDLTTIMYAMHSNLTNYNSLKEYLLTLDDFFYSPENEYYYSTSTANDTPEFTPVVSSIIEESATKFVVNVDLYSFFLQEQYTKNSTNASYISSFQVTFVANTHNLNGEFPYTVSDIQKL